MTPEERRKHAERLIQLNHLDPEFSLVYEDEDLEDASEEDLRAIHDLMNRAKITVTFPDGDA